MTRIKDSFKLHQTVRSGEFGDFDLKLLGLDVSHTRVMCLLTSTLLCKMGITRPEHVKQHYISFSALLESTQQMIPFQRYELPPIMTAAMTTICSDTNAKFRAFYVKSKIRSTPIYLRLTVTSTSCGRLVFHIIHDHCAIVIRPFVEHGIPLRRRFSKRPISWKGLTNFSVLGY